MKNLMLLFVLGVSTAACTTNETTKEEVVNQQIDEILSEFEEEEEEEDQNNIECDDIVTIESFKNFLGMNKTVLESDLIKILGKHSDSKVDNNNTIIHSYRNTKNIPLSIFINNDTKILETARIEMLCKIENFESDKKRLDEDFIIDPCQLTLFGMQPKEVTQIFGAGDLDNIINNSVENDVRSITYYTEDSLCSVTFKFYHSQDNKLSSIEVNWNF